MLTPSQIDHFERDGYLVVERTLEGSLLEDIRREAHALADVADAAGEQRRTWHERVLFRRKPFRQLLQVPRLVQTARALIGEDVQLLALDLLYAPPGGGGIGWHRDVTFTCNKTLSMNTGVYLYDMADELGPLRVVPGSHRTDKPPAEHHEADEVVVPVSAGTAVFFDAGLLHSGSPNRSSQRRLAVFPYFGRYFVKRMDNYFTQALPAELLHSKDPFTRQLLGLGLMEGAPNYHGDNEAYNRDRGEVGIDFAA